MAACGMLGQSECIKRQRTGGSWSASDIAEYVMAHPNFGKYTDALLALANADPETRKRMLGFDPSRITPEQFAENYQRMIAKPAVNSDDTPPPACSISPAAAALADLPATAFAPVLPLVRCRNSEDEQVARLSGLTGATSVQI